MAGATLQISTEALPPDGLAAGLGWLAKLPVSGLEIGPRHSRRLHASAGERSAAVQALREARPGHVSLHAWTGAEGLGEVVALAGELGARLIVVHCPHEALTGDFDGQVRLLRGWDGHCRGRGMVLTVENASRQPLEPFAALFEAVPGLRLTLDVKHAYKPETLGLTHADYLGRLGARAANFHVSGIDRARDALGDGVPPGNDAVDWDGLAADLLRLGYAGLITVELSLPADLGAAEMEHAYGDLPAPSAQARTPGERLALHGALFFRRKFAPVLGL